MAESVETVVVGAGQAGLSVSYHLKQRGREHVVLERGRIADTWRTQRWDGFFLNTPNWAQLLPGHEYRGDDPDGFAPLAEVIAYLDDYATAIGSDVREGVEVSGLRRESDDGYTIQTDGGVLRAVVGVHWQHKRKSSLFLGVGEDAEYVAEDVARGVR